MFGVPCPVGAGDHVYEAIGGAALLNVALAVPLQVPQISCVEVKLIVGSSNIVKGKVS